MKFTKKELYEMEKVLDTYAGWISDCLNKYCNTAINYDAIHYKGAGSKNLMDSTIKEMTKTQEVIKSLRDKLEKGRLK